MKTFRTILSCLLVLIVGAYATPTEDKRPVIVFIIVDDLNEVDPNEWVNLANEPEHKEAKQRLTSLILANQHPGLKVQRWFDEFQESAYVRTFLEWIEIHCPPWI